MPLKVEFVQGWTKKAGRAAQDIEMGSNLSSEFSLPAWLPDAVRLYLDHTEQGVSLRQLARREGCHASTVMRQVRRFESLRDAPLVDEALCALGRVQGKSQGTTSRKDAKDMTAPIRPDSMTMDESMILREGRRILRRLAEPETVLAIAADMEKAAVLRSFEDGRTQRLAVMDRAIAQAFALKDWISCDKPGRISTYQITQAGRAAWKRMAASAGCQGLRASRYRRMATDFLCRPCGAAGQVAINRRDRGCRGSQTGRFPSGDRQRRRWSRRSAPQASCR